MSAFCALVFMRIVDLAVFDAEHDHADRPHVQAHAAEMVHDHDLDEPSEHDTLDAQSTHMSFHTLLGVFIETATEGVDPLQAFAFTFGSHANKSARSFGTRPPVPPPLA